MTSRPRMSCRWVPALLALPICTGVFAAWLTPANLSSWLPLLDFCGYPGK